MWIGITSQKRLRVHYVLEAFFMCFLTTKHAKFLRNGHYGKIKSCQFALDLSLKWSFLVNLVPSLCTSWLNSFAFFNHKARQVFTQRALWENQIMPICIGFVAEVVIPCEPCGFFVSLVVNSFAFFNHKARQVFTQRALWENQIMPICIGLVAEVVIPCEPCGFFVSLVVNSFAFFNHKAHYARTLGLASQILYLMS